MLGEHNLTVEIHDVTPAWRDEVAIIQEALRQIGVARTTLLVVPAFVDEEGGAWDLREHPDCVAWLQREQRDGCELVLHGLTHRAPGAPPPGARNWVMHHWVSRGCAEFAHLDRDEAARRIAEGRAIFTACGLEADGFIAPAWQQSAESLRAVSDAGFRFTAFMRTVVKLSDSGAQKRVHTPVLTFAAARPSIDYGKRVYMRAVEASSKRRSLIRVAIHPEDVHGARPLNHAIARLRALLEHRAPTTYAEWLS